MMILIITKFVYRSARETSQGFIETGTYLSSIVFYYDDEYKITKITLQKRNIVGKVISEDTDNHMKISVKLYERPREVSFCTVLQSTNEQSDFDHVGLYFGYISKFENNDHKNKISSLSESTLTISIKFLPLRL